MKPAQLLGLAVIGTVGAVGGVFGGAAQGWATRNLHLSGLIPGASTAHAAAAPAGPQSTGCSAGWTQVGVADSGGFPLEVNGSEIRQTCSQGGTNSYGNNDVFQVLGSDGSPTGQWVAFVGGCHFVDAGDHNTSVSVAGC